MRSRSRGSREIQAPSCSAEAADALTRLPQRHIFLLIMRRLAFIFTLSFVAETPVDAQLKDGDLIFPIQVASVHEGGSIVPPAFKHVILELGANTLYTVRDTLLEPTRPTLGDARATPVAKLPLPRASVFVLSFEPQLNKYAFDSTSPHTPTSIALCADLSCSATTILKGSYCRWPSARRTAV